MFAVITDDENKNNLRTIEAQIVQKLKNNEARPKFTGSYKKKSVYINKNAVNPHLKLHLSVLEFLVRGVDFVLISALISGLIRFTFFIFNLCTLPFTALQQGFLFMHKTYNAGSYYSYSDILII